METRGHIHKTWFRSKARSLCMHKSRNMHVWPWRQSFKPRHKHFSILSWTLVNWVLTNPSWILIGNKLVSCFVWSGIKEVFVLLPTSINQIAHCGSYFCITVWVEKLHVMWTVNVDLFSHAWINSWSWEGFTVCLKDTTAKDTSCLVKTQTVIGAWTKVFRWRMDSLLTMQAWCSILLSNVFLSS